MGLGRPGLIKWSLEMARHAIVNYDFIIVACLFICEEQASYFTLLDMELELDQIPEVSFVFQTRDKSHWALV